MFFKLFILFTTLPLIEIVLFLKIGNSFGYINTILIVLITGALGAFIAQKEGVAVFNDIKQHLQQGILPSNQLWNGFLLLISGVFLITPGIITDILGILLLLPQIRTRLFTLLKNRFSQFSPPTPNTSDFPNAEPTTYEIKE